MSNINVASSSAEQDLPPHSDNPDEELQRIHLALEAVFSPQRQPHASSASATNADGSTASGSTSWWERRQLADRYLTSFQTTAVSWMVCDRLLQDDGPVLDVVQQQRRFFAAQTLHTKCRSDVYQLPRESLPSLRDSLVNHLTRHASSGDTVLMTRLALAVAALAVQMSWTTVVSDLLTKLENSQSGVVVLEVLRVLPEECASDRLILVDENVRYVMRDHLISSSPAVLQYCQAHTATPSEAQRAYGALHTWIRYVPVPPTVITETQNLMESTVQTLTVPESDLHEVAVDLIVEILRMYPSHIPQNEMLVQKLIPLLLSMLQPAFDRAMQNTTQPGHEHDEEDENMRGYCRIVTEMGESYMSLILSQQHYQEASKLVEWVLRCSAIADKEIASMTLHFWYRFVVDLELIEPYELRQNIVDAYTPLILRLLDICSGHLMQYPADLDELSPDAVDDIHRDRYYVAETVEDCCRLLGGSAVLRQAGNRLKEECQRVQQQSQNQQICDWQRIESCLYCIQSIHRYIPNDENDFLPFCMNLIPQLPPDVSPLRFTASLTIGKYASWLATHPQHMQPLMPYLAQGLSNAKCSTAAAVAIKELCEWSNQHVALGEPVLQLYQGILSAQEQQQQQHADGSGGPVAVLDLRDELEILEGVCKAVSRQLQDASTSSPEATSSYLTRIVQPIGARLTACISDPNSNVRQVMSEVDRLTVIVRYLHVPSSGTTTHPTVEIITSSWSLLDAATKRFSQDTLLAEKICRFHKHALRGCGPVVYAPLLESLIKQLESSFQTSLQSPYLYCASICITEFGRDPAYVPRLFEMIVALSNSAFGLLKSLEDLTAHPDVVEELFYLMGRVISYCPEPLVVHPLLRSLFQCALVGMQLDHRDANRGTLNFLENTVSYGLTLRDFVMAGTSDSAVRLECKAALESTIRAEGQAIVTNLARALMGDLPAYSIDVGSACIAGILWKLNLLCPDLLRQWINTALISNNAPDRTHTDFLGSFDGGLTRDEFNGAIRAFVSTCDRHRKLKQGSGSRQQ